MKRFFEYLIESAEEKKYAFKIKIAGALPDNCEDCMEAALQKYKVCKFSKGKRSPIQETLLDFPELKNQELTVFEAEVDYPATSTTVLELISQATGIGKDYIRVRTPREEENWNIENEHNTEKKESTALLGKDYEKLNGQHLVGDTHVSGFLKSLAKLRKETEPTQYKGVNDSLLAKAVHKETPNNLPTSGPARSLFGGNNKEKL